MEMNVNPEIEREVILHILKRDFRKPIKIEELYCEIRFPKDIADLILNRLSSNGYIQIDNSRVRFDAVKKMKMALLAIKLGSDVEKVCKLIDWRDFEGIAAEIFEVNGYSVVKNFRFSSCDRRWEIDVLAYKKPIIICVDCKHWIKTHLSYSLHIIIEKQTERIKALLNMASEIKEKLKLKGWKQITALPVVISLYPQSFKFYDGVPIVPILQLSNFIYYLPTQIKSLKHFKMDLDRLDHSS